MDCGIEKCKTLNVNKGKVRQFEGFQLENNDVIDSMEDVKFINMIGFAQSNRIQHSDMKVKLKSLFARQMVSIWKAKLNGNNEVKAINTLQYQYYLIRLA